MSQGVQRVMRKRRNQAALHLEQVQAEALAELGTYLRQCRELKEISLEQIAASTKIQRRLLEAIELGKIQALPESIYVRGLVRRFAEALDLPGEAVAQKFPIGTEGTDRNLWKAWSFGQLRPIHLYLLYIFLIFSAINGLSVLMNRSFSEASSASALPLQLELPPRSQPQKREESKKLNLPDLWTVSSLKAAFPLTASLTEDLTAQLQSNQVLLHKLPASNTLPVSSKPVQVVLTIKEQSWVRIQVDGVDNFEGILLAGTQRTWGADKKITIRAGNAGGVLASFNNEPAKPLGEAGAVEEVSFELNPQTLATLPSP